MSPDGTAATGFTIRDAPPAPTVKAFSILTADDLLSRIFPPRELTLSPWLPSKGLVLIYGARGIGKTHLTLGCGYAISSGGGFLRWRAPAPRRVLIIDGEMPAVTLQERLSRIVDAANEAPPDPAHLRFLARLSQLAVKHPSNGRISGAWCRKVGTTEWTVIMLSECRPL